MNAGIARVAICFLAKFGLVYSFMTFVVAMGSMYVLVIYFTSTVADRGGNGSKPVAPSVGRQRQKAGSHHLKLASNLKYLQESLTSGAEGTLNYGAGLMEYVREYTILPSCSHSTLLNILITSAPRNFRQRTAIRDTWCARNMTDRELAGSHGNRGNHGNMTTQVRCVFMLGTSLSVNIQRAVQIEAKQHGDILQGSYLDSYRNLTVKVLHGLSWSHHNCPSHYVLKTDDDCFVNVPVLKSVLRTKSERKNVYVGHVMEEEGRRRVVRDPYSKWHVTPQDYAPDHYPPYISGSGYLLSGDLVELVLTLHTTTPLIPIEDAYIGILLHAVGITPLHSNRFSVHPTQWQLCNLLYYVVIHHISLDSLKQLTTDSVHSFTACQDKVDPAFSWR